MQERNYRENSLIFADHVLLGALANEYKSNKYKGHYIFNYYTYYETNSAKFSSAFCGNRQNCKSQFKDFVNWYHLHHNHCHCKQHRTAASGSCIQVWLQSTRAGVSPPRQRTWMGTQGDTKGSVINWPVRNINLIAEARAIIMWQ